MQNYITNLKSQKVKQGVNTLIDFSVYSECRMTKSVKYCVYYHIKCTDYK